MEHNNKTSAYSGFNTTERVRIGLMRSIAEIISAKERENYVLKGGTGLLLAYGLTRYSTDLDFDGKDRNVDIAQSIELGTNKAGIKIVSLSLKKDTDTTKRYMLHYEGSINKPLKIEISFRDAGVIDEKDVAVVNGIRVYTIEKLAELKAKAFANRAKARDIYDIAFILETYPSAFKREMFEIIAHKVSELGLDDLFSVMKLDSVLSQYDVEEIVLGLDARLEHVLKSTAQRFSIPGRLQEIQNNKEKGSNARAPEMTKRKDEPIR